METYFTDKGGLTLTSANSVANKAKERYEAIQRSLSFRFYEKRIKLLGVGDEGGELVREGTTLSELCSLEDKLMQISKLKSLIAWLREAIKTKEELIKEAQNEEFEHEYPEAPVKPMDPVTFTKTDMLKTFSIGELQHYYELEAKASVIGSMVHLNGELNKERKALAGLEKIIYNPEGKNTVITYCNPTVKIEDVNLVFEDLTDKHRKIQAELNGMLHTLQTRADEATLADKERFLKEYDAYEEWEKTCKELKRKYREEDAKKRLLELKALEKVKILIPDNLKETYESL